MMHEESSIREIHIAQATVGLRFWSIASLTDKSKGASAFVVWVWEW